MTLLSPLGLLWLGTVPVLIWLWRFAASKRQTVIPSLVPFEHLLRRPPTRRTHLVVNLLFWLQLAALVLIALALAEPALLGRRARTVLVLMDTSASMGAATRGPSPLQHAKRDLLGRLGRRRAGERFFLVSTAPVTSLTPEPLNDPAQLRGLVTGLQAADLSGNLSVAHRLGLALLGERPDETLVLTDEPIPERLEAGVTFRSFGQGLPNVAIVGVEAHEMLCAVSDAHVVVTVQNFAGLGQSVRLTVRRNGRRLAERAESLGPGERRALSVGVPQEPSGLVQVEIAAKHDALAVDNRTLVHLRGPGTVPVTVASERPQFVATVGRWLEACPRIAWTPMLLDPTSPPANAGAAGTSDALLITDDAQWAAHWPTSAMLLAAKNDDRRVVLTHWLVDASHPIGAYLDPVEPVPSGVPVLLRGASAQAGGPSDAVGLGEPVLWSVIEGRRIPLLLADEREGRRAVSVLVDPTTAPLSQSWVVVFLNSLRWLTARGGLVTTGKPLVVGPFEPGLVRIERPRGGVERMNHDGGLLRYDATVRAGEYRFVPERSPAVERIVNFMDPVESDTMSRLSTWEAGSLPAASQLGAAAKRQSVVPWLLGVLFAVCLLEWLFYNRRSRRTSEETPGP